MKTFISQTGFDRAGRFCVTGYAEADKINKLGLKEFEDRTYGIIGWLDCGKDFTVNLDRSANSRADAERVLRDLCALIGKHSKPDSGTVMLEFDGRK